jgi:2-keto-3-deoxy-L-rhamnonate aldolase RhmA
VKPNRLKDKLKSGQIPVGHMILEFGTRGIAQILDNSALDFVLIDTEHSPFTSADLADLMAWFKATPIAPIVRIPEIHYHFIARTLDAGALGVMVPDVTSGDEARAIVDAVKYAPLGKRGMMMHHAHTDYLAANPVEYTAYANQNTAVICQIESVEGLDNLEAIASTPGIDILWVGHSDLTQSMGIPGQLDHPQMLDALKLIVATAHKLGLAAGAQPGSLSLAREWIALGFNVISYSTDLAVYSQALQQGITNITGLTTSETD